MELENHQHVLILVDEVWQGIGSTYFHSLRGFVYQTLINHKVETNFIGKNAGGYQLSQVIKVNVPIMGKPI